VIGLAALVLTLPSASEFASNPSTDDSKPLSVIKSASSKPSGTGGSGLESPPGVVVVVGTVVVGGGVVVVGGAVIVVGGAVVVVGVVTTVVGGTGTGAGVDVIGGAGGGAGVVVVRGGVGTGLRGFGFGFLQTGSFFLGFFFALWLLGLRCVAAATARSERWARLLRRGCTQRTFFFAFFLGFFFALWLAAACERAGAATRNGTAVTRSANAFLLIGAAGLELAPARNTPRTRSRAQVRNAFRFTRDTARILGRAAAADPAR
jgi:hypothetical protein